MSGVFSIAIDRRFADALAAGVLAQHGGDPLALADVLILLPTRRSVRALREAFLRASGGKPTLLPQMAPLGDVDDGDWQLASGDDAALTLPPAIDPAERDALLTRLVANFTDGEQPIATSYAQALSLARELGRLLDELAIEGVPFDRLEGLVDGAFASHWQQTLKFLRIVGEAWPSVLAERGQIDAIDRRTRAIRLRAERWRRDPPATPVIAAGSTGSQPATRELLAAIAALPQGQVVLPGLDREMDERSWDTLDETHPQFGLRELLKALGCPRHDVVEWPGEASAGRGLLVSELMRPAETSEHWVRPPASTLEHVTRADGATPHQEALVVALALRETLEKPGRTAALVTPDRNLARRVAAELRRWNIDIDDSAGAALADTLPAGLLRLLVAAVDEGFAPIALLALLKHPLCTLGLSRADLLSATRTLDACVLRGLKPAPGLGPIRERTLAAKKIGSADERRAATKLIDRLEAATAPLATTMREGATPLALIDATVTAAEAIAGSEALWSGEAGEALADALARLRAAWADSPVVTGGEWPALLEALIEPEIVRPSFGRHPRLAIWGPLEARLQRADLLVMGGLNEGTWPPSVDTGPWLNRPMRKALGLPQPERRIGLSAHDFVAGLGAGHVLLTRAERDGGAPTVRARWLARLDALFGHEPGRGKEPEYMQRARRTYLAWADQVDRPAGYTPAPRPAPRPPLEARPTKLSVSGIELLRRDPYGVYARYILRVLPLDPLEQELGAADRGNALHKALQEFMKDHPSGLLPEGAVQAFEQLGERHLVDLLAVPAERAFWWPRFQRLARWLVGTENERRATNVSVLGTEVDGSLTVGPAGRELVIEARADRVDRIDAETWEVIDYKSGRVPSGDEIDALFAPQLLLEAAMAERGGFAKIKGRGEAVRLSYWQANGLKDGGKITTIKGSDKLVGQMIDLAEKMAVHYRTAGTAYPAVPWPKYGPYFNNYAHLERVAEWVTAEGEE